MIKNDRQYKASSNQLTLLRGALKAAQAVAEPDVFVKAHKAALEADIKKLEKDIADFKKLRTVGFNFNRLAPISHLGEDLVRARVALNVSQKQLAQATKKHENVIQRYEDTYYENADLETLQVIYGTLTGFAKGEKGVPKEKRVVFYNDRSGRVVFGKLVKVASKSRDAKQVQKLVKGSRKRPLSKAGRPRSSPHQ